MIKKILLTLLILIILAVAGIIALVVFVNPNHFKGFISETVKDKTGYELTIDGDLRWHIWPQISILTDSVKLEDEGAKKPLLTADNMRLDVELFPLFSKQLAVKNVLVKSAIINISDESKGQVAKKNKPTTTVNQNKTEQNQNAKSKWSFTLNKLEIADSTVVYQQGKDFINFRDINIKIEQNGDKNVALDLSGSVNRDQQDFIYSLNANVDLTHFPDNAKLDLHKLDYVYKGVGVPAQQLKGQISAKFDYQKSPMILSSDNFVLTVNDNKITGKIKANLDKKPNIEGSFASDKIDLTSFLPSSNSSNDKNNSRQATQKQPVVSSARTKGNELAFLNSFDANFVYKINEIVINKLALNNFVINAQNKNGVANINNVDLDVANGHINANGIANGKLPTASIKLATKIANIDLGSLFRQLEIVNDFKGQFNANGNITADTINPEKIITSLTGNLDIVVNNARLDNLNIQQIVQSAIASYYKKAITTEDYQKYTELNEVSAYANLSNGDMNISSLKASSATLDLDGNGRVGLAKRDLDIMLEAKILSGWNQDSKTIQKLQNVTIPLRIYGNFNELHYQIKPEQLINALLSDKLQNELGKFKDRLKNATQNNDNGDARDDNSGDNKQKIKELFGDFINKHKDKK